MLSILRKSASCVEIGFGEGRMLESLLKEGVNVYGVDISEKVVDQFRSRHPQYRERVRVATGHDQPVDAVYGSALLEHLDHPQQWIRELSKTLNPGGSMIIDNLPVLNPRPSNLQMEHDICFWKPCHRIIFSLRGLKDLFGRTGYSMERFLLTDPFLYRVLSLHLRKNVYEKFDYPGLSR